MNDRSERFDLAKRTELFGKNIILFVNKVPKTPITNPLITQLTRSGTSVGANYREADCAESRRDFEHKLGICKKESSETQYWLEILLSAVPGLKNEAELLQQEAKELQLIFIAIIKKSRLKPNTPN